MPIVFNCSTCGKKVRAPDDAGGKRMRCPACQAIVTVPMEIVEAEEIETPPAAEGYEAAPAEGETYQLAQDQAPAGAEAGQEADAERSPCPMCGEMIRRSAAKCRYCGEVFDPELRAREERQRRRRDPSDSSLAPGEWALAILCSGIGCIFGIVWMIQGKPKGIKMFGVSLAFVVLWNIIRFAVEVAVHNGP
jgi:predicted RNA-binding Zn-ribbon protein involved in translation (DUF1610 family)